MESRNWAVIMSGGSIGDFGSSRKQYRGKPIIKDGLTRSEAKALAARRRKQLSPGERSYYRMSYSIVEIK